MNSGNPPGPSLVVVKDGDIAYNNAFGHADGPGRIKADTDTVYHWWSMAKIPIAIAILQLREQGKLNLDEPVTQYLPWFDVNYPSNSSPTITIRHLLQHTSGLPDTIMRLYPENGMGVAVLANGTDLDRERLMDLLAGMDW